MTGAGLPPIALEAVRKILAIGQDSAHCKKPAKSIAKPSFRLEMIPPAATFDPPRRLIDSRNASKTMAGRRPSRHMPPPSRAGAEGAESC